MHSGEAFLAAVATLAPAAEGQFDAGAGTVAIHKDLAGADAFGHAHLATTITGPDGGDQTIVGGVGQSDGIGFVIEGQDGEDGTENFFTGEFGGWFGGAKKQGRDEVAGGVHSGRDCSLGQNGDACFQRAADDALDALLLLRINNGSAIEIHFGGAGAGGGKGGLEPGGEFGHDTALDQNAATGGAGLAGILQDRFADNGHGQIQIGVGEHDLGRLTAQFECAADEMIGRQFLDNLADGGRAGEGNKIDAAMGSEGCTGDRAASGNDVDCAGGEAGFGGQLREAQRSGAGIFGGFEHYRITGGERRREGAAKHLRRVVPGKNVTSDAIRFTQDSDEGAIDIGHHFAVEFIGSASVEFEVARKSCDIGNGCRAGFAGIAGFERGEFAGMAPDEIAEAGEHAAAVEGRGPSPWALVEGPAGGAYRGIHIFRRAVGNGFPRGTCGGVYHGHGIAGGRGLPNGINEVAGGTDLHWGSSILRRGPRKLWQTGAASERRERNRRTIKNMVGKTVSHYTIIAKLGGGGMGDVYKAKDSGLDRFVALKFLKNDSEENTVSRRRFLREARSASALDHPNIGTIYEVGESPEGLVYIAMAYYKGQTLRALLKERPMEVAQVLDLARQVAAGLAHAHGQRIIHRDIKPANVMVTPEGLAKIVDFGLARTDADPEATLLTLGMGIMGTPTYMAPEQAVGSTVDQRADIWAWAVVTYEMLTGKRPFSGPNVQAILYSIVNTAPVPPRQLCPEAPEWLDDLIMRALEKDPARRIQSMAEVSSALRDSSGTHTSIAAPENDHSGRSPMLASNTIKTPEGPSIAVLPLRNVNADPEGNFFSEGLTDELIAALAQIPGLRVVSRNSSFALKDRALEPSEVGRMLHVQSMLDGSIRRMGNRIRVTAQLTSTRDGSIIWSQKYDRDAEDIFAIQEDIAKAIAEALLITLGHSHSAALIPTPQVRRAGSAQAQDLYVKGRYHLNRSNPKELGLAIEAFEGAIAIDERFALAYSGLADAILISVYWGLMTASDGHHRAQVAAMTAIELDDSLAEGHNSLAALMLNIDWRMVEVAEREFKRALQLNPNYGSARFWYATAVLLTMERYDEARDQIEQAVALDPLSPAIRTACSSVFLCSGDTKRAIQEARRALELDPNYVEGAYAMAGALRASGKTEEAIAILDEVRGRFGDGPWTLSHLGMSYAATGRTAEAREMLAVIRNMPATNLIPQAWILLALDEMDEAIELLRKANLARDQRLRHMACGLPFAPLRKDPRYPELQREFGLVRQDSGAEESGLASVQLRHTGY